MAELLTLYATFMLISLSGALSPGPLTALSISEGARAGRWAGTRLALGHGLVEIPLVFAIAYGLGEWLRRPLVGGLIGLVGAAVLLWMGYGLAVGAWRGALTLAAAAAGPRPAALRFGHVPGGVMFTVTNPYWSLWWATLGATYVARVMPLSAAPAGRGRAGAFPLDHRSGLAGRPEPAGRFRPQAHRRPRLPDHHARFAAFSCWSSAVYFAWSGFGFLRQI